MMKKVLFYSFLNVFDCFRPCERMRKHAFAGRIIQQITHHSWAVLAGNLQLTNNLKFAKQIENARKCIYSLT